MLTDTDRAILDLESKWWKHVAVKHAAAHDLGLTPTRYYAVLNALLDRPAALAYSPLVVKRLRRLRDARRAARSA